jgi:hypothetical protein
MEEKTTNQRAHAEPRFFHKPLFIGGWEALQSKAGSGKLAANSMQNPQNPMQFLYIRGL